MDCHNNQCYHLSFISVAISSHISKSILNNFILHGLYIYNLLHKLNRNQISVFIILINLVVSSLSRWMLWFYFNDALFVVLCKKKNWCRDGLMDATDPYIHIMLLFNHLATSVCSIFTPTPKWSGKPCNIYIKGNPIR